MRQARKDNNLRKQCAFQSAADGRFLLNKTGDTLVLGCQDGAIPDGVKKIGGKAFEGRTGLKEIDFNEVEEIGEYAFAMCAGLDRLKLTSAVRTIGDGAFSKLHRSVHRQNTRRSAVNRQRRVLYARYKK